jgi:CubicO group peptidase (beta-lactamase class C family)
LKRLAGIRPAYKIQGHVAPGFERVKSAFEFQYEKGYDEHSQLCVYVGDKRVVDLYGVTPDTTKGSYDADTLQIVMSNSKTQSAIVFSMLVAKGLVNYEDKIADHWPEFA